MRFRINDTCITFIYILSYISALSFLRHTTTDVYSWRLLYLVSVLGMIALGIVYIISKGTISNDPFMILLAGIVLFELFISSYRGLFIAPMIIVDVITWPLTLAVFYEYSKNNPLPESFKRITMVGMIMICITSIPAIRLRLIGEGAAAVFATYYCIAFLPMILMLYKNSIAVLFSGIVSLLMLLTFKRAAFIIVTTGLFLYYYIYVFKAEGFRRKKRNVVLFVIGVIAFLLIGYYFIEKMELNILERLGSIAEDGGSGRIRIWMQVIDSFNDSSLSEKVFGHGFHAVFYELRPLGIPRYAHNSFLETLYDYGYLGLTLLLVVVMRIIIDTGRMIYHRDEGAPVMAYSIVSMMVLGNASYFFEQSVIILPFSIMWGICMGRCYGKAKQRRSFS